jgi:hypothetical protein
MLIIGFAAALASPARAATASGSEAAPAKPASAAELAAEVGGKTVVRVAHVPASSLPPARRKALMRPGMVDVLGNYTIYEFNIYPVNGTHKCLDASTSSPYKGMQGDPVQLYSCFNDHINHANQWWNPINTSGNYVELQSWAYPDLCLTGQPGYFAALAECNDYSPSMYWDWYHFRGAVGASGSGNYGELASYQAGYSLAAYDTGSYNPGQNGDPVLAATTYNGVGYEEWTY